MREMLRGFAAKLVLDRLAGDRELPRGRRRRRGSAPAAERRSTPATVKRGPLFMFMLACAGIGVPVMILLHNAPARIIGVLALFGFIVAGVFVIADPAFLAGEEEGT